MLFGTTFMQSTDRLQPASVKRSENSSSLHTVHVGYQLLMSLIKEQ
jgi:hypothetical protein